jgi:hypothetical protein
MSGEVRYAPVPGAAGEPLDVCEADVVDDPALAEEAAQLAADATGGQFRVVQITELMIVKPRRVS